MRFWGTYRIVEQLSFGKGNLKALSFHSNPIDCYCMYKCLACQFESEK